MGSSPAEPGTALVVGGGISGLLAARELAAAGHEVTVLEAGTTWGGCVGSHTVAGLTLDSGAESFATRSDGVARLCAELGLGGRIVPPRPGGAWVQLPDGPRELPRTGVLGIPANPWDPEVRRTLGIMGSLRASLDRLLPASVGAGKGVTSVSALVRARMGSRVLERLVSPVVGGVHSADPGLLDVDMVAPGLRAGLRQYGSLAAAVSAQRRRASANTASAGTAGAAAQPGPTAEPAGPAKPAKAGSAVAGLEGGMHTLVDALVADLRRRGVTLSWRTPLPHRFPAQPKAGASTRPAQPSALTCWSWPWTVRPPSGCWKVLSLRSQERSRRPGLTSSWSPWCWTNPSWTGGPVEQESWWPRRRRALKQRR
ncbi:protoporphyrinogen oxidase [Arthrobacter sp. B1I2]|nr:protoporphyrinogen oxidase [Arthrobacter sp. B1I2]